MKDVTSEFLPIRCSHSCDTCGQTAEKPHTLGVMKFCNYKCAFRYVWRIIYGRIESVPYEPYTIELDKGWTDEHIKVYSNVEVQGKYSRKDSAFLLVKAYLGGQR